MKNLNCIDCKNNAYEMHEEPCLSCIRYSNLYPVDINVESKFKKYEK